ncbi:uncharacterized protein LOC110635879 isoform X2 [Hevea brasiliensis]|uniref:uncharacterized protein LOC110635879 isoform X2 n=1 Tax=Hevea brasiliensis TaxID=3981 RepID=UPI0025D327DF|nr:uncharacterized protein LOC110635879 isoform X2 [Hevea brasiliensis]
MLIFQPCSSSLYPKRTLSSQISLHRFSFPQLPTVAFPKQNHYARTGISFFGAKLNRAQRRSNQGVKREFEEEQENGGDYYNDDDDGENEFPSQVRFSGREEEKNYDKDPEFAEILGSCLDDPQKAQNGGEIEEEKKQGFAHKDGFSYTYEGHIQQAIRAWHIIGRLGGCNSMNMQLSQSTFNKRPNYDAIQGANVTPTTFYNIGDFEIQDNLARIWVDIGITEPLLLDVLINALTQISSDYVGIKQMVFGGSEFETWKESLTSEDAGCSIHQI